jgi:phospholipid/cholesterol/gamma-HCH transport system ATP-binding protein
MIEIENISKSFGDVQVLKNISATFEKGVINQIIGKSGSGKSVLTKCIVGLHVPDTGRVLYDGRSFHELDKVQKREVRKEIGMLFQNNALFDSMSLLENVMFPLRMFSEDSEEQMRERAAFCLERVRLSEKFDLYPSELSGGMQKRAALARAIALNPKYLFCDEPNSGLDPQTAIVIDELIKEITLEYGMTTLVITHDMNSVMGIGDKIMFIHEGQKWWEGDRNEILFSDVKELNDFVFAGELMREVKAAKLRQ